MQAVRVAAALLRSGPLRTALSVYRAPSVICPRRVASVADLEDLVVGGSLLSAHLHVRDPDYLSRDFDFVQWVPRFKYREILTHYFTCYRFAPL